MHFLHKTFYIQRLTCMPMRDYLDLGQAGLKVHFWAGEEEGLHRPLRLGRWRFMDLGWLAAPTVLVPDLALLISKAS